MSWLDKCLRQRALINFTHRKSSESSFKYDLQVYSYDRSLKVKAKVTCIDTICSEANYLDALHNDSITSSAFQRRLLLSRLSRNGLGHVTKLVDVGHIHDLAQDLTNGVTHGSEISVKDLDQQMEKP